MSKTDSTFALKGLRPLYCRDLFNSVLPSLHRQHVTHSRGSFLLGTGGDVGVGIQCEPCGEVAQHTGDGLDVHAVLQRQGCEGMAQVVEADAGQPRPLQHPVQHVVHAVRRDGAAGG